MFFQKLMDNFRKPQGCIGSLITTMMNTGHAPMTKEVVAGLNIKPEYTILDVGCGGGGAIKRMSALAGKVYGIDFSPTSIQKAKKINQEYVEKGRVVLELCSVDDMSFSDNFFDIVTTFESVYFWQNPVENFKSILKSLKPGGTFAIALEAYVIDGKVVNVPDSLLKKIHSRAYSEQELQAMLEQAGFVNIHLLPHKKGNFLCILGTKPEA